MVKEKTKQKELAKSSEANRKELITPRGRIFEGIVIKKFHRRIVIQFERTVYIPKYERFYRKKTKLHARLPDSLENIQIGDYVRIQECRPLSKIIHFVVLEKVTKEQKENKK